MLNLVVVNGEKYWGEYLPEFEVHYKRLQTSKWIYRAGELWVFDESGALKVDAVLWRVGAIRPEEYHRTVLEMIRMSGIPCINPAETLLRGYDRLSMLNELLSINMPVSIPTIICGDGVIDWHIPKFPVVVKVGNYNGGLGKVKVMNEEEWEEIKSLIFTSRDYVAIEPFIDYEEDIRCLIIGDQVWAMSRKSHTWKANHKTSHFELIEVPTQIEEYTRAVKSHLNADTLGLDFLKLKNNHELILLESNDIPGLSGFNDDTRIAIANVVRQKIETVHVV